VPTEDFPGGREQLDERLFRILEGDACQRCRCRRLDEGGDAGAQARVDPVVEVGAQPQIHEKRRAGQHE